MFWQMQLLQVAVCIHNEPPEQGKEEPGKYEGKCEYQKRPAPLWVNKRCIEILHEAQTPTHQVLLHNIAIAILKDGATAHFSHATRAEVTGSVGWKIPKFILRRALNLFLKQEEPKEFCFKFRKRIIKKSTLNIYTKCMYVDPIERFLSYFGI